VNAKRLPLFLETPTFTRRWDSAGLTDIDLAALQWILIADPNRGTVVQATGGFRKVRFAPPGSAQGKSGSLRVIYLPLPALRVIVLGLVYAKNESATLNAADKADLRRIAVAYEAALRKIFARRD
jgi:hypothetical protein